MLSELAIDNAEAFTSLVVIAKEALEGKVETVKEENTTKEIKTTKEETDLSKLTVAELREMAKAKNIAGAASMKKAELLEILK